MRPLFRLRTLLFFFLLLTLVFTAVWFVKYLHRPTTLPFRQVVVTLQGTHLKKSRLEKIIQQNLQGGFFSLNKNQIVSALVALPWVSRVEFRKIWPDQLLVTINEKKAIAVWNTNALVSGSGQLFYPAITSFPKNVVSLSGVTDDQLEQVLAKYRQYQSQLVPLGLVITALQVDARGAWQMQINGHISVVLGRDDMDARFNQFIKLFPQVVGKKRDLLKSANLNYPNGFALGWKHSK